ncbi:hypothetical protein AtEden1_Chr1g0022381 [Arabidopsis thaliana]
MNEREEEYVSLKNLIPSRYPVGTQTPQFEHKLKSSKRRYVKVKEPLFDPETSTRISWREVSVDDDQEQEHDQFKWKHVYSHIGSAEEKDGAVAIWLHSLNQRNYPDLRSNECKRNEVIVYKKIGEASEENIHEEKITVKENTNGNAELFVVDKVNDETSEGTIMEERTTLEEKATGNDGSIIAFNPETVTEQARLIPSCFHQEVPDMKLLLAADDKINRLTLISGTKETISVYTLLGNPKWTFKKNENPKWALDKRIKNVSMEGSMFELWNVVAYDGKRLVVREMKDIIEGVVHVYDMEANSWRVLCSTKWVNPSDSDFYKFTPSMVHVGEGEIIASNDRRILDLTAIMELINTTK